MLTGGKRIKLYQGELEEKTAKRPWKAIEGGILGAIIWAAVCTKIPNGGPIFLIPGLMPVVLVASLFGWLDNIFVGNWTDFFAASLVLPFLLAWLFIIAAPVSFVIYTTFFAGIYALLRRWCRKRAEPPQLVSEEPPPV